MDISALFTSEGPGGLIAFTALLVCLVSYGLLIRWIARGGQEEEEQEPWDKMGWPFD
jgi:hypothetical protein